MARLDGLVCIVTGAAQGIGATFAEALAKEDAIVAACDVGSCDATVQRINSGGGEAYAYTVDVTDSAAIAVMVEDLVDRFGHVDVLINNAGIYSSLEFKSFLEISDDEWDAVMRVNVRGVFQCCKAVAPTMARQKSGKIINVCSGSVYDGVPYFLHYVSSKSALLGLTRALARELGDDNICVNGIAPGLTESDGVQGHAQFSGESTAPAIQARALKRAETPDDVIGALLFFASADSDFVTGQTLLVDGGSAMR